MDDKEHHINCPDCKSDLAPMSKKEFVNHLAGKITDVVFEEFWKDQKSILKHLSKKEFAEEVFFQAVALTLENSLPDVEHQEEN